MKAQLRQRLFISFVMFIAFGSVVAMWVLVKLLY